MMYLGAVREGGGRLHRSTEAGVIQFLLISFTSLVQVTQCITTSCDGFIEMNSISDFSIFKGLPPKARVAVSQVYGSSPDAKQSLLEKIDFIPLGRICIHSL